MTGKEWFFPILSKITSARFYIVLLMTFTFCFITYKSIMLFFANIGNKEALDTIEKIVMFILGSFCTQMANVIATYFNRLDRQDNSNSPKQEVK